MFKSILNPGQNADNLVKLYDTTSGCCGNNTDVCQYWLTIPTANAVNKIVIKDRDGNNKDLTTGFPATGATAVKAAIKAAILAEGYDIDSDQVLAVASVVSGPNTIYKITGDLIVVSATHNTSTSVSAVQKCTRINRCTFFYAWPGSGSAASFIINGTSASLASKTLAGNTAAEVKTAVEALANWPTTAILSVTETATAFELTITDNGTNTFELGGATFERSDCAPDYA